MFGGSWIADNVPSYPSCVILTDPNSDTARCGRPARGGKTILDWPICDECYDAVGEL